MIPEYELKGIINRLRDNSLGDSDTDLSSKRADALNAYKGEPYGDEMEGRSQVVSKDIAETVDYILPQFMRTMLASGNVVQFDPTGPEDEALAEQESDYVNHVMLKQNDAWVWMHDWAKDGLMLGNGYVKHSWVEKDTVKVQRYAGLNEDELVRVMDQDDLDIEVIEQEERDEFIEVMTPEGLAMQPIKVYDVKIRVKAKKGCVLIEAVPPSEVRVDRRLRGCIQDANYFEHCPRGITRTDLIEMGMDKAFVESLSAFNEDEDTDEESSARDIVEDDHDTFVSADHSMDEIEYREIYIRVDADEDGKAELRKITIVGDEIPPGPEWNEEVDAIPFTYWTPKRMPHRHIGEGMYDELKDIQRIQTTLKRNVLDNIYFSNNAEKVINERAQEYLDDYLVSVPGGIKRVSGTEPIADSVHYIQPPQILNQLLPAIDLFDQVKESRTGVGRNNAQLDADLLKQTTAEAFALASQQANAKVEMFVRMFGQGVKEVALQVHRLILQHQDKPAVISLRGEYVNIDPNEWQDRDDLTVNVGLGTGNAEEERANLREVSMLMDKLQPMGLVGPQQMFNLFSDIAERMGFANPMRFVMDPKSQEFQQASQQAQQSQQAQAQQAHQQQVELFTKVEEVKGQFKLQGDQIKSQTDQARTAADLKKQKNDIVFKLRELEQERELSIAEMEMKAFIEGLNFDIGEPGMGAELND